MEVLNFDIKNYNEISYEIVAIIKCTKKIPEKERYFEIGNYYPIVKIGEAYDVIDEDMDADYPYNGYGVKYGVEHAVKTICDSEWFKFEPVKIDYINGFEVILASSYEVELI